MLDAVPLHIVTFGRETLLDSHDQFAIANEDKTIFSSVYKSLNNCFFALSVNRVGSITYRPHLSFLSNTLFSTQFSNVLIQLYELWHYYLYLRPIQEKILIKSNYFQTRNHRRSQLFRRMFGNCFLTSFTLVVLELLTYIEFIYFAL